MGRQGSVGQDGRKEKGSCLDRLLWTWKCPYWCLGKGFDKLNTASANSRMERDYCGLRPARLSLLGESGGIADAG